MGKTVKIEHLPDSLDSTVHHVRGGYHVSPGLCLGEGCLREKLQGFIVVDLSVSYNPAVTVARILTHTEIGHNENTFAKALLDRSYGLLDDPVLGVSRASEFVLFRGDTEKQNGRYEKVHDVLYLEKSTVNG